MTVKELIIQLNQFDQDMEVFMSKDPEGNRITPLDGFSTEDSDGENMFDPFLCLWPE